MTWPTLNIPTYIPYISNFCKKHIKISAPGISQQWSTCYSHRRRRPFIKLEQAQTIPSRSTSVFAPCSFLIAPYYYALRLLPYYNNLPHKKLILFIRKSKCQITTPNPFSIYCVIPKKNYSWKYLNKILSMCCAAHIYSLNRIVMNRRVSLDI